MLVDIVPVAAVRILTGFVVELTFADGAVRVLDLEPYLTGPVFEPLRQDPQLFHQVQVDSDLGTIAWPNGADISPRTLYRQGRPTAPTRP